MEFTGCIYSDEPTDAHYQLAPGDLASLSARFAPIFYCYQ